ncbi:MAG: D-2-hydroxyacid dehydrogenase [Deltaproteobacteria bacterium]|nr:D-2-hydroxyacid dehydrogenase [Deltaproteobacteria bacterium]
MSNPVVWCNFSFSEPALARLRDGLRGYELITDGDSGSLARAHFAFGQPPPQGLQTSEALRFVQLTSAGYTAYENKEFQQALKQRGVPLAKASWVYDEPCADHALAFMLCAARALPLAQQEQRETRAWSTARLRQKSFLLRDQNVLIVGFGSIGRRLAERLAPFGAIVRGARRSPGSDEPVPMVSTDNADFASWLAAADHVVNVLPLNTGTNAFFNDSRFGTMKAGALFYNIGRGGTVDQAALQTALQSGRLAGAYLDVTVPEPLPPTHPLWQAPNCFITPHTAGGHANEQERLVDLFLGNLSRLGRGEPLIDRVF